MRHDFSRIATVSLATISAVALGACGQNAGLTCAGPGEDGCAPGEAQSATPVPPEGYVVKYSTCAHFIEGDAKVHNNSRVVQVRADGTIPLQRAEPVGNPHDDLRRVIVAKLPHRLIGGEGVHRCNGRRGHGTPDGGSKRGGAEMVTSALGAGAADNSPVGRKVAFVKLGQIVATKEADGSVTQWVVGSDQLGEPVNSESTGRLEYQDTCFRKSNVAGKDTAGRIAPGVELANTCVIEDLNQEWNTLSALKHWAPLVNYSTSNVPSANSPVSHQHPDGAYYERSADGTYLFSGAGAALNDINGTERDETTNYIVGYEHCHMIITNGSEVPGAKRPATKSLPAPGVVNGKTFIVWRPVNPNVNIANEEEPLVPDLIEPAPAAADVPVDAADALVPM